MHSKQLLTQVLRTRLHNGLKLTHSLDEIRNAVDQLEWGKGSDSKDFLNPTKHILGVCVFIVHL